MDTIDRATNQTFCPPDSWVKPPRVYEPYTPPARAPGSHYTPSKYKISSHAGDDFSWRRKSAGERFSELKAAVGHARSDSGQEEFFYTIVKDFILDYGTSALDVLHAHFTQEVTPKTAKFYYTALLGRTFDRETEAQRNALLRIYENSSDDGLRLGASDALEFLTLV